MPLTRLRKIKNQLKMVIDNAAQKEEELYQMLVYIGILMHIRRPR